MQDQDTHDITLTIEAVYDPQRDAVGIRVRASPKFEAVADTKVTLQVLATINAQTNLLAAQAINAHTDEDAGKRALLEHWASLKEYLLDQMLSESTE